ncbi:myocyte enhancer factor [Allomyces arbusculus]|nr:myocyte enhancer factor [Allomyces arbusculus]
MGRRKIKIELIPGERTRQATFIKRRMGIMKKAYELAELCGCQIGMLIFSSSGKLFEFSSTGDLDSILLRYAEYTQPHEIRTSRHYKEPGFQDTHVGATTAHADADSDDDDDMEQDVPLSATDPAPPRALPTPAAAPASQPAQNGASAQQQEQQQQQQQSQQLQQQSQLPVGIAPPPATAPCPVPGHGPDAHHRVPGHGAQYANGTAPPTHRHAPSGHSGYYQDSRPTATPQHLHPHAQHPAPLLHPLAGPFAPAPAPAPPSHAHGPPAHVHGPPHAGEGPQNYHHPHYYPHPPPPVETAPPYSHPPPPGYYPHPHTHVAPYPAHGPITGAPHHAPYAPPPPPHCRPYDAYHDAPRSAPPGPAPRPQSWPYAPTDVPSRFIDPHPHMTPGSPLSTMAAQMDPSRTVHSPVLKRSASDMLDAAEAAALARGGAPTTNEPRSASKRKPPPFASKQPFSLRLQIPTPTSAGPTSARADVPASAGSTYSPHHIGASTTPVHPPHDHAPIAAASPTVIPASPHAQLPPPQPPLPHPHPAAASSSSAAPRGSPQTRLAPLLHVSSPTWRHLGSSPMLPSPASAAAPADRPLPPPASTVPFPSPGRSLHAHHVPPLSAHSPLAQGAPYARLRGSPPSGLVGTRPPSVPGETTVAPGDLGRHDLR